MIREQVVLDVDVSWCTKIGVLMVLVVGVALGPMVHVHDALNPTHVEVLDSHDHDLSDSAPDATVMTKTGHFHLSLIGDHIHDTWSDGAKETAELWPIPIRHPLAISLFPSPNSLFGLEKPPRSIS